MAGRVTVYERSSSSTVELTETLRDMESSINKEKIYQTRLSRNLKGSHQLNNRIMNKWT